jgi:site-specific DNA-methyltransferase (adenine-specific)/adenine-specific DNA-methyltransferase
MPTLNWIGKEAVVNHHHQVPFHLLKDVPDLACGEPGDGNLIVQGDNLVALKALLPYYAGQVKCIYIDPPYNTGNENWVYNDNVNSPIIREWLGKTVGKEGETLDRHDRWLCMMYPRLALLRQFLRQDGVIFVSIDDNEIHDLRYLMDDLFGEQNFIACIEWQKIYTVKNSAKYLSEMHDHLLFYAKRKDSFSRNLRPRDEETDEDYDNPDDDERIRGSLMHYSLGISTAREHTRLNVLAGELLKVLLREHTGVWLRPSFGSLMLTEGCGGARIRMESQESRSFFRKRRAV